MKLKAFQTQELLPLEHGPLTLSYKQYLDIRKELWEVVDSTAVSKSSGPSIDLSGDWVGKITAAAVRPTRLGLSSWNTH